MRVDSFRARALFFEGLIRGGVLVWIGREAFFTDEGEGLVSVGIYIRFLVDL